MPRNHKPESNIMGSRANIIIKQNDEKHPARIWVYAHWEGDDWARKLQQAMREGAGRWDDEQYLGRYIVTSMCGHKAGELTGYGVSTYPCDNSYDIYEVDVKTQTVTKWPDALADDPHVEHEPMQVWSFEEFIAAELFPATEEDD